MRRTSTCLFRNVAITFAALFLVFSLKAVAQTPEHGRESATAVVNFSALAAYYAAHPDTPRVMRVENDEDEDERPPLPKTTDTSMARFRHSGYSSYSSSSASSYLPASPSPTDTFQATYDNNTSIPPDTHGDVDSNYAVTAINTSVHIQTRAGANVSSVSLSNFFLPILPGGGAFDPRVIYDPYSKRWFLIADANAQSDSNILLVAVSQTSNPTGSWYEFRVIMDAGGTSWLDYPTVGYNKKWITVGGNRFNNSGGYRDARVLAFNKAQLMAGTGAPYTAFTYTSSFTISPAITYDTTLQSQFCVESWDGTAGQMRLWKITGAVGSETMTSIGYPSTTAKWQFESNLFSGTAGGDFAPQSGTSNKMQTNDDRVYDCKYMNGTVWCSHNVFLPYSTTTNASRCSAQWWQIDTNATPIQIGLIDDPSSANFYYFPAIAVNKYNDALIGFSTSSSATHVNAGYALHLHTDPADSMRPLNVYRHGGATYYKTYSGTKNRWGDYSNTSVDPINLTDFWTLQECASTTADRWDTWWAHVKVCVPPAAVITPAGPTTFCTGGNVVLNTITGTGLTYQWKLGGTDISGATNSSYTASATGSYSVRVFYTSCDSLAAAVTVTVNTPPSAGTITGTTSACVGATTTLSDATTGGTWSSVSTGVATVNSTGVVTGVTAGTSVISYTVTNACGTAAATATVTINPLPTVASISGPASVCAGGTITLTDATTGGVWTSGSTGIATVNTSGVVTGVGAGSAIISYTVTNGFGCVARATATVTVNVGISATITPAGPTTFCTGGSVVLNANTGTGYTYQWQLGGTPITAATNASYTASVAGNYTVVIRSGACAATSSATTVTINTVYAAPITGASSVCIAATATVADTSTGGVWSSGSTGIATINSSGVITGVAAGTAVISYSVTNACGTAVATRSITVNSPTTVAAITGTTTVCSGGSITLADATAGGVWTSGATGIATINTSGVVTGVAVGSAPITYTVTNSFGCVSRATTTVTVTSGISATATAGGATTFCAGGSVTLSSSTGSGYTYQWQVGGTNISGATSATYTVTTSGVYNVVITQGSCVASSSTITVTVNAAYAAPISGASAVCIGANTTLTDATTGGTWTSGSTGIASVSSAGIVYGLAAGTAVISYSVTNACGTAVATRTMTVSAPTTVAAITGATTVCPGNTITLADATTGGVWSSTNTTIATVSTTGVVRGIAAGSDTIKYSVTNASGCTSFATTVITVLAAPAATITAAGPTTFCTGGHVILNATAGSGLSYQWKIGGSNISGATNASYNASTAGVMTVVITNASGCATTSAGTVITVTSGTTVVPAVSITANPGIILCSGSVSDTFTAIPVNGGSAPAYQWYVNGTATATTSTMRYTPGAGDVVKVKLTSNATCALPDTASASVTITISGFITPSVSISPYPNDTVCSGTPVTLTPVAVNGGSAPTYTWTKNGIFATAASSYTYLPANGDVILVTLRSSFPCLTIDTAVSSPLTITVDTNVSNTVTITASRLTITALGQPVTFTATAPHGGSSPAYQWLLNGLVVPGATNSVYVSTVLGSGQVVTCRVTSSDPCASPNPAISNGILVTLVPAGIKDQQHTAGSFLLVPNPNNGTFTISGTIDAIADGKVTIKVADMLGQIIYINDAQITNGTLNEHITLDRTLANGIYVINIISAEGSYVMHMVLNK